MDYTILVADDYQSNLTVIESIFEESGESYDLLFAADGQEACEMTLKHSPDLIIMDWDMPQMSGLEAVIWLKSNELASHIPIIMTTAYTSSEHLQKAMKAGAMDYVKKPIDEVELLARVHSALVIVSSYKKILAQKDVIEKKSEQLESLYKVVKKRNEGMMSSLRYAKRIQDALLPQADMISTLQEAFILFHPRDVVSGDFYWINEQDGKKIVAAVDCTGHGVPGAFMSMLGNSFLNQIIKVSGITDPAKILSLLHDSLQEALHQSQTRIQDGMAISICVIDEKAKKMTFAGAKQPLVYIRNRVVEVIKGDRIWIGGLGKNHVFTNHELSLEEPAMYYLFSDGYQDQFSSNMRTKFMAKRFRKLLLRIYKQPIDKQKELLSNILYDWMMDTKQVDDILVIGFKR